MSDRAQYVEALRIERAALNNRVESAAKKRRIADVEAELEKFAEQPATRRREKAAGA
jgi:hypothetical protein